MSPLLYGITVHHVLCSITDSCISMMSEVQLQKELLEHWWCQREGSGGLSRGQGKKIWHSVAMTKIEGFCDERLVAEEFACRNKYLK